MQYDKGKHTIWYNRYHLVWIAKYRYKVLLGDVRIRVREIIWQVCSESRGEIIKGVLATDHVHMVVSILTSLWKTFWGMGYFLTTNGAIPEYLVPKNLEQHSGKSTDASRWWCSKRWLPE